MKKEVKKKNYPVLDFIESKVPYKKKKKNVKINHSIVHTLNTNKYLKYL